MMVPVSKVVLPRYPIYIPSKGRAVECKKAVMLRSGGVPFQVVVEPQEHDLYASRFGSECILTLPFSNLGLGSIPARNWIKDHATEEGHVRHWQLDDNIRNMARLYKGRRLQCPPSSALVICEDFTDRYENIAISGLNCQTFVVQARTEKDIKPFVVNTRVYSCTLVLNSIPYQWRGRYNEDTDLCLQALAGGWCTVLINAVMINKQPTMTQGGGNTDQLYQGDGRLKMARSLERQWPGVVETKRRFGRPQHVVNNSWKKFDTPLIRKADAVIPTEPNEYEMVLKRVKPSKDDVT
jgi:hypothetical protein